MKSKFTPTSATFTQGDTQITYSRRTDDRVVRIDEERDRIVTTSPQAAREIRDELKAWGFKGFKAYESSVLFESDVVKDNLTQERMLLMIEQLAKKKPTGAVRLADLREWLSDYPREKLDELLLKARSDGKIILYQDDDNLTANKPRHKNAALHYRASKYDLIYLDR